MHTCMQVGRLSWPAYMHTCTHAHMHAGGKTQLAGIITAVSVILTLLFLTPFFTHVPKCVLASCLIVAVSSLVDTARIKQLWGTSKGRLVCICIDICTCIYICTCIDTASIKQLWGTSKGRLACICIYICIYVCLCICTCIYTYITYTDCLAGRVWCLCRYDPDLRSRRGSARERGHLLHTRGATD